MGILKNILVSDPLGKEIAIYENTGGIVEVRLAGDSVWLRQEQLALLFATSTDNVSQHLKNIYAEGELNPQRTTEDFSVVRQEGKRTVTRTLKHYNLDAAIL